MRKNPVAVVLVLAGLAHTAWAGGQQVGAEAGPDGRSVVVRTHRCGTPASLSPVGTAEGRALQKGASRAVLDCS